MTASGTQTVTYTVVDIRKVLDNFAADYAMVSQATGLSSREEVAKQVADIKKLAENSYIEQIKLILRDSSGKIVKAATYEVSTAAAGWASDRPGNALWPKTIGGSLGVFPSMTKAWWDKTDEQRSAFFKNNGTNYEWTRTTSDNSLAGLSSSDGQSYASNGYGLKRKNYS